MSNPYLNGPKATWLSQATRIASGEIAITETDIPYLLEWLKDMNWPGADEIAEYIPILGESLLQPVEQALNTRDFVWISGILKSLSKSMSRDFWIKITPSLEITANQWDAENAHIEALYLLAKHRLSPKAKIKEIIKMIKEQPEADPDDYTEIEALID